MATNQYFNKYNATNEQNLLESQIIESIQIKGLDVVYIERTQPNMDYLLNEDSSSVFSQGTVIEMYPAFASGFDGDGELMSKFGLELSKSGKFVVSKKRFLEAMPMKIRPNEGDLIFMPVTNAFLEIKYVDIDSPFFEKGKTFVYELSVETYSFSHETFNLQDQEAIDALDIFDIEGIINTGGVEEIETVTDPYASNNNLDTDAASLIVSDPSNPFGVK